MLQRRSAAIPGYGLAPGQSEYKKHIVHKFSFEYLKCIYVFLTVFTATKLSRDGWLNSSVVKTLDLRSRDRGFDSSWFAIM